MNYVKCYTHAVQADITPPRSIRRSPAGTIRPIFGLISEAPVSSALVESLRCTRGLTNAASPLLSWRSRA